MSLTSTCASDGSSKDRSAIRYGGAPRVPGCRATLGVRIGARYPVGVLVRLGSDHGDDSTWCCSIQRGAKLER